MGNRVSDTFAPPAPTVDNTFPVHGGTVNTSIYDTQPYSWDGKTRPNINDYTSPWIEKASEGKYKYTWFSDSRKKHNTAVTYAQNQLDAAIAQYNADMSYWYEQDERAYTTQLAQAQRYEDAGFNMGYVYGQVDNGNSAVGYNDSKADLDLSENVSDDIGGVKQIVDCVATAFSIGTSLLNSGISLKKLPLELAQMGASTEHTKAQTGLLKIQQQMESFIQSHDSDGDAVDSLAKSLAFSMKQVQHDLMQNQTNVAFQQNLDLIKWNTYASKIYEIQSTPTASEAYNSWVMEQDLPDWCKTVLIVLGSAVGSGFSNSVKMPALGKRG